MKLDDNHNIVSSGVLGYNGENMFQIGHKGQICTKTPEFLVHDGIWFFDCPGVQDEDKTNDYLNATIVNFALKKA